MYKIYNQNLGFSWSVNLVFANNNNYIFIVITINNIIIIMVGKKGLNQGNWIAAKFLFI